MLFFLINFTIILDMGALVFKSGKETLKTPATKGFFDFQVKDIRGKLFDFQTLRDRKLIMVVNVACK